MKRLVLVLGLGLILLIGGLTASAQGGENTACPALVDTALTAVGEACSGLERNTACYGHNRVDALFWNPVTDLAFSQPSDRVGLRDVQTIATAPLSLDSEQWGVALLHLQANLPDTLPGQAVTMLLMGDATVTNQVAPQEAAVPFTPVPGTTASPSNLRSIPTTNANVVGSVPTGTPLTVIGINEDRDWLQVEVEGVGTAWIYAGLVNVDNLMLLMALPVTFSTNEAITHYGPMQAVYFTSGLGAPECQEAPNAMIVQSPERVEVTLAINELEITIGSTIVVATAPTDNGQGQAMVLGLLEGRLQTRVNGYPVSLAEPGRAIAVTLNDQGLFDRTSRLVRLRNTDLSGLFGAACNGAVGTGVLNPSLNAAACSAPLNYYVPPPPPTAVPTTVAPVAPPAPVGPEITFVADRTTIGPGECVSISWSVANVQAVYYQGEGVTGQGGTQECPRATTTYTLTAVTAAGEQISRALTITVQSSYSVNFWADQTTIPYGECTVLHWDAQGVSAVYYQGEGVTGQGSRQECLSVTSQTYTLLVVLPSGEQITYTVTLFAG
jgi:hypothetical protein